MYVEKIKAELIEINDVLQTNNTTSSASRTRLSSTTSQSLSRQSFLSQPPQPPLSRKQKSETSESRSALRHKGGGCVIS